MLKQSVSVQDVLDLLNEVVEKDPACAKALLENRVPCNKAIADHPTTQVHALNGNVGLLGILNGLFGIDDESGMGAIAASVYPDNGNVCKFEATVKDEKLKNEKP